MKKTVVLILVVILSITKIFSQVNLQTGSATFSLPIFNWQDDKSRLNSGIAINYSSGNGLKVNEVASNIGQGWNLLASGVITRMQVGAPDDQKPKDGNFDDINKYPAGYLYNAEATTVGCPKELINYPIFDHANQLYNQHNSLSADREQDYFSFQFNGRSGLFVLGKNNGDNGIVLGDSKLKVWFQRDETLATQQNCRTTIMAFYIQDENGLIYKFNQIGKTKVLKVNPSTPSGAYSTWQPEYKTGQVYYETAFDEIPLSANPYVIGSWYLTEIKDPLTSRLITISYTIRNIINTDGNDIRICTSDATEPKYAIVTHKISNSQTPVITSITYPDGHNILFNYSNLERFDLKGDFPFKSIDIFYNQRKLARYLINTTYFIGNTYGIPASSEQNKARLCLKSVMKIGVDLKENEQPYLFEYYTGSGATGDFVPPPFYYFQDIWGYYDGGNANNLLNTQATTPIPYSGVETNNLNYSQLRALCFLSANNGLDYGSINPGFAKNGLLKSINYPTGGQLNFEYEQNKSFGFVNDPIVWPDPYTSIYSGGVHVSKTTQTDNGYPVNNSKSITTVYTYERYIGNLANLSGNYSSLWGVEFPSNGITSSFYFVPGGQHHTLFSGCKYDYTYTGILSREESQNISDSRTFAQALFQFVNIASTLWGLGSDIYMLISSSNPASLIMDVVGIIINIITECSDDYKQDGDNFMYTNYNVNGRNALPYIFSRVEIKQNNSDGVSETGKTVYEFTTDQDYPLWNNNSIPYNPLSMRQRFAPWAYGLPKKITVYDGAGNMIKQTENVYNWNYAKRSVGSDMSCNCTVTESESMNSPDWMNLSNQQNLHYTTSSTTYPYPRDNPYTAHYSLEVDQYPMYTGRVELMDIYERTFKKGDATNYLETKTHYDYNPVNYSVNKVTTTLSNGDKNFKEIYYTVDYPSFGILKTLSDNNIVNLPVASYTSFQKSGSSVVQYTSASVSDFTTLPKGEIKPSRNFVGRSATPVAGFTFNSSNPFSYPGLIQTGTFTYDANDNLVGVKDEGNHLIYNIYDYDDKFITASLINADPTLVPNSNPQRTMDNPAYTSFETSSLGGWTLSGNATYTNTNVATGARSLVLSGTNSLSSGVLNTNKPYILTFWSSNSTLSITNNAGLIKSGPTIGGLTYYEYAIATSASNVSITGTGTIDELRLYPKAARMRTVTYDPLIGKTSECDENGRIIYYEYDKLGRLQLIKDENRNIIKMYEYNTKQNGIIGTTVQTHTGGVFAKVNYENMFTNAAGNTLGDVVIRLYSDASCTTPLYMSNFQMSYIAITDCDNGCNGGVNQYTIAINGTSVVIGTQVPLNYQSSWEDQAGADYTCNCSETFTLVASTNYIIVN